MPELELPPWRPALRLCGGIGPAADTPAAGCGHEFILGKVLRLALRRPWALVDDELVERPVTPHPQSRRRQAQQQRRGGQDVEGPAQQSPHRAASAAGGGGRELEVTS